MTVPSRRASRVLSTAIAAGLIALAATGPAHAATSTSSPFGDRATPRIVGGTVLPDTSTAPYTVAIQTIFSPTKAGGCSGSVIDAQHILTAAHCVVEGTDRATPDEVTVAAGTASVISPEARVGATIANVQAIRVHPRYDPKQFDDDVAVLTLAAPLDLTTGRIAAIPLAPANTAVARNRKVRVTGFGITSSGSDDFGTLREVTVRSVVAGRCGTAPGAMLCTLLTNHGACQGDSGGSATIGGTTVRALIGVTDVAAADCSAGLNLYANLAAPEIRNFVIAAQQEQDVTAAQTPLSPRGGAHVKISGVPRVGRTVTCHRGKWSKGAKFRYAFVFLKGSKITDRGLHAKSTYKLRSTDRGKLVTCQVEASNAGGTGLSNATNGGTVRSR